MNEVKFLENVNNWLISQGEIFLYIYFPYSAGSRDFEFHSSVLSFESRFIELKLKAHLIVLKNYDFKLRGKIDSKFIKEALAYIKEEEEFMLIENRKTNFKDYHYYDHTYGQGHDELKKILNEYLGKEVALGKFPIWDEISIPQIEWTI